MNSNRARLQRLQHDAAHFSGQEGAFIGHASAASRAGREPPDILTLLRGMRASSLANRDNQRTALENVCAWLDQRVREGISAAELAFDLAWLHRIATVRTKTAGAADRPGSRRSETAGRPDHQRNLDGHATPRAPHAKRSQPHGPTAPARKQAPALRPVRAPELSVNATVQVEILLERTKKGGLRLKESKSGLIGVLHPRSRPIEDPTPGQRLDVIVASSGTNPQFRLP
jgi:hypothetical protein